MFSTWCPARWALIGFRNISFNVTSPFCCPLNSSDSLCGSAHWASPHPLPVCSSGNERDWVNIPSGHVATGSQVDLLQTLRDQPPLPLGELLIHQLSVEGKHTDAKSFCAVRATVIQTGWELKVVSQLYIYHV